MHTLKKYNRFAQSDRIGVSRWPEYPACSVRRREGETHGQRRGGGAGQNLTDDRMGWKRSASLVVQIAVADMLRSKVKGQRSSLAGSTQIYIDTNSKILCRRRHWPELRA